jgi:hypothetical protein
MSFRCVVWKVQFSESVQRANPRPTPLSDNPFLASAGIANWLVLAVHDVMISLPPTGRLGNVRFWPGSCLDLGLLRDLERIVHLDPEI